MELLAERRQNLIDKRRRKAEREKVLEKSDEGGSFANTS